MTIFTHVLASLVFVLVHSTTYAQQQAKKINVTPEQAGFASLEVQMGNQNIKYFVSTEGKPFDKKRKLPLVLYLHGSGPSPLMWNSNGRVSSSILYDASEFPGFHFALISKPGIRFFEQTKHVASKEYDQNLSLGGGSLRPTLSSMN